MTADQPAPLDLGAVRERAGYRSAAGFASPEGRAADIDSADDVPALLAEVERLRAEIGSFIDGCLYVSTSHADPTTQDNHRSIAFDLRAILDPRP